MKQELPESTPSPVPESVPGYYLPGLMIHGLLDMVDQCGIPYTFGKALQYCTDGFLTAADLEPVISRMISRAVNQTAPRPKLYQAWTKEDALAALMGGIPMQGNAWVMLRAEEFWRAGVLKDEDLKTIYAAVESHTWAEDLNRMIKNETRRRNCQGIPATDTKA